MAGRKRLTTITSVRATKPDPKRQVEHFDSKVRGLALRVTSAGRKSWVLRYRSFAGAQRRLVLGGYPAVSLAKARTEALKALGGVGDGQDPAADKRARRASSRARRLHTLGELIEDYLADAARGKHRPNARPKRAGTMALDRYYFDRFIGPRLGKIGIEELTRSQVQRFLDDVGEGAPSTARHCRAVIRQAYNYAIRREVAKANPAQLTSLPRPKERERVLSDAELQAIWHGAGDLMLADAATGCAIRLAMLTLQRGGEVVGIHEREIDRSSRTWTIPGERTKNHRTHVVPLSDAALEVLDAAFARANGAKSAKTPDGERFRPSGYAFPARRGAKGASMTRAALSKSLKRLTDRLKITDATPHDFRRTGATNLTGERIGLPRFIVSRVLNQLSDTGGAATVTGVYDRNEYLADKRRALEGWAAVLAEIVAQPAAA